MPTPTLAPARAQRRLRIDPADARSLTEHLRTPAGTMALRPLQAAALIDLALYRGLLAAARVGAGKTLIAGLAPVVTQAQRPLLVVPAALREETRALLDTYRVHWRIPHSRIISYHDLSNRRKADLLWEYLPDLLVFDEVHKLKNVRGAGCARRVAKFLHEHPETRFVGLSGTPIRRSLKDYAHILRWAVRGNAPLPSNPDLISEWAQLLDEEDEVPQDGWVRTSYAVLEPILGGPITSKDQAREAYGRALELTPGVVISAECYEGVGLTIRPIRIETPPGMAEAWEDLRDRWTLPDGWDLADKQGKSGVWAAAQEFALGFYNLHDPRPPDDWMRARREWCSFCRRVLEESQLYDTEAQVRDACLAGQLPDHAWRGWERIKDGFTPNTVPCWLSDHALRAAELWGRPANGGGIIWTHRRAFGQALAERTGWPYYAQDGKDQATGLHIRHATAPTIIASERSNSDGRNLQKDCGPDGKGYCRNLFTAPPKTALDWEQRTGRTHRDGQTRDVTVDYFVGCRENFVALPTAISYAQRTQITERQTLKLIQPGVEIITPPDSWAQGPAY